MGPPGDAKVAVQGFKNKSITTQESIDSQVEADARSPRSAANPLYSPRSSVMVMERYHMRTSEDAIMGEGTSSICRKGIDTHSGEKVAIKSYKMPEDMSQEDKEVTMQKFVRQVKVLQELQEPFVRPDDPKLWHPILDTTAPSKIFMRLLDYSKDASGHPAPDAKDGIMYVVTELASYSMKDYIRTRRDQKKPLAKHAIKAVAKSMLLATAGLHAKGFIHLDLKPENLMIFNGALKVIDVDGCVKQGTKISVDDSSLSFSPCYCAPEWARFLIDDSDDPRIEAVPALDAWSIGITIAELVTLDAVFKPTYASFMGKGRSNREAGFLFMEWLGGLKVGALPSAVARVDPELASFLQEWLLIGNASVRRTCAECLDSPYAKAKSKESSSKGRTESFSREEDKPVDSPGRAIADALSTTDTEVKHAAVRRREDLSYGTRHKGTLWKLNEKGDPNDPTAWLQRDMWIASNGGLCYFSFKENKRLVLVDAHFLQGAEIVLLEACAMPNAFRIISREPEFASQPSFAANSVEDRDEWMSELAKINQDMMTSIKLGRSVAKEIRAFRMMVKNRRQSIGKESVGERFRRKLWKVKGEGDRMKKDDWFQREMWITTDGNLVYHSVKEERDLIYYTAEDLRRSKIGIIPSSESYMPWTFQVQLAGVGEIEFTPGEFAAESEEDMQEWIAAVRQCQAEE